MTLPRSLWITVLIFLVTWAGLLALPGSSIFNEYQLDLAYNLSDQWVFIASMIVLGIEGIRLLLKKAMSWNLLGDTVTNFITQYAFIAINYTLLATVYITGYYVVYEYFSLTKIPTNLWTVAACIVLADIVYYWEHRTEHRFGIGWATHTVHHSSPNFNMSVAYRFGPLDGFVGFFYHLPLVLMGFNPMLVFLSEAIVLMYQTFLHTELVGKLPRPIEALFNTPSHHRVHHGANKQYHDKNYGGIFIVWDRLFGTFAKEEEKVVYGITEPLNSVNPINVFFHGFYRLYKKVSRARGWRNKIGHLIMPPGWEPDDAGHYSDERSDGKVKV